MRVTVISKNFETDPTIDKVEKIYGTRYSVEPLS
jgi:hypothetical protein